MQTARDQHAITEGVIWKQLMLFFLPLLFGSFFQHLYTTVDAVVVGRFAGKEGLAAIDATASMLRLFVGFFVGLSSAATILIAQQYGAKQYAGVDRTVHTAVAFSIIGGGALTAVGLLLTSLGIRLLGIPSDIAADATAYVRIYFLGMIPSMLYNMGASILRAVGNARKPLYFLIISSLLNVGLDLLFVVVFRMGVVGAGIATVLAQVVSAALMLFSLVRTSQPYGVQLRRVRLHGDVLRQVLRMGLPIGLQSSLYPLSNMVVHASVNRLGTNTIAAWAVCGKLDFVIWMIMDSLAIAVSTFVGQNYGAGNILRVRKSIRASIVLGLVLIVPLSAALMLWGEPLSYLFINDQAVASLSGMLLRVYGPFFFVYIWSEVLSGAIRGTGETFVPMLMTLLGTCALRILWVLLIVPRFPGIVTIVLCYPVTWVVTSLAFILYYARFSRRVFRPVPQGADAS